MSKNTYEIRGFSGCYLMVIGRIVSPELKITLLSVFIFNVYIIFQILLDTGAPLGPAESSDDEQVGSCTFERFIYTE